MYAFEVRMKAVKLYIQSLCSESTIIRTLGYPHLCGYSRQTIKNTYTALDNQLRQYVLKPAYIPECE